MGIHSWKQTVHLKIENAKKGWRIHLPSEYIDVIESTSENRKYKVEMLKYNYFLDYTQLKLISSIKPRNDAMVNNIHYLKYSNGGYITRSTTKKSFKNLRQVGILILTSEVLPLFQYHFPIAPSKYGHLQEQATVIPTGCQSYYAELEHD